MTEPNPYFNYLVAVRGKQHGKIKGIRLKTDPHPHHARSDAAGSSSKKQSGEASGSEDEEPPSKKAAVVSQFGKPIAEKPKVANPNKPKGVALSFDPDEA